MVDVSVKFSLYGNTSFITTFGKMAEVAFSEDGKYFSAISQDGRLRIWDTETNILKQEFTPDLHLSSPPSCLQWILVGNMESPRKGGRKSVGVSETQNQCIALGTTNGKILIYSVAQAKVETVLEDSKNSEIQNKAITSLDWHRNYGLFSSNKEGFVYEWDLRGASFRNKYNVIFDSKNKQASSVSAIKIVPHNQKNQAKFLVTASWQVRLWRLVDGTIDVVKIMGHSGAPRPVLMLATLPNNRSWLIEGSQNERLLSFWDVTITQQNLPQVNGDDVSPTKKQRKKSTSEPVTVSNPSYNFVLEDAPKTVDVCVRQIDGGVKVNMAAATRSGVVHYYGHMLNGSSTKPIKPSVTIQVTTEEARPLPLQCCKFVQRSDAGDCVLGYEPSPARIVFERVTPDTKSKTQVLIRSDGRDKQTNSQTDEVNRVRSASTSEVTYVEPLGGVSRKRVTPGAKVEVPMEARLANLALDTKGRSKSAVNQNLTKLLVQGLHSKDRGLILTVLQSDDPGVALRTVSSLPADYVPLLLEQLTDMATKKTSQAAAVCTWLSALLRSHSALLLATLNSRTSGDQVTQLLAIFTQRRSHLCQLLNLKGRLDLTITQRSSSDEQHSESEPVLEYNDSTSDEEMEEKYQSGSDEESWADDKFDGTDDQSDGDT